MTTQPSLVLEDAYARKHLKVQRLGKAFSRNPPQGFSCFPYLVQIIFHLSMILFSEKLDIKDILYSLLIISLLVICN